jgi:hypothetical protein
MTDRLKLLIARTIGERCAQLQGVEVWVSAIVSDRSHMLYRHPVHSPNLRDQQIDKTRIIEFDHELIDYPTSTNLENLNPQHVPTHGSDPARHLAERTRAIREPYPYKDQHIDDAIDAQVSAR